MEIFGFEANEVLLLSMKVGCLFRVSRSCFGIDIERSLEGLEGSRNWVCILDKDILFASS
jgi:hypothetical protein